jgi:predicted lipoprotein with Yx(FWY)xxD motif
VRKKLLIAGTVLAATTALLGACGGSDDKKESTPATSGAPRTTVPGTATVRVEQTSAGQVLVDSDGKTVYLFTNDQGPTSAVPPGLQAAWPPVEASGAPVAGDGVDASKLETAQQPDGRTFVTYDGHPLYRFSGDTSAGQANGHKLGNVWYAVTPSGAQAP